MNLLPCPFCGTAPGISPLHGQSRDKTMIACTRPGCHVAPSVTGDSISTAVERWNKRPSMLHLAASGTCGTCGFHYAEHHGHLIACPVCALTATRLLIPALTWCVEHDGECLGDYPRRREEYVQLLIRTLNACAFNPQRS